VIQTVGRLDRGIPVQTFTASKLLLDGSDCQNQVTRDEYASPSKTDFNMDGKVWVMAGFACGGVSCILDDLSVLGLG